MNTDYAEVVYLRKCHEAEAIHTASLAAARVARNAAESAIKARIALDSAMHGGYVSIDPTYLWEASTRQYESDMDVIDGMRIDALAEARRWHDEAMVLCCA